MIVPIEVKSEINLKAKNLKTFCEKFSPKVTVRTSMANYKKEERLISIPLYLINQIEEILNLKK